jgi:hypothetical protein
MKQSLYVCAPYSEQSKTPNVVPPGTLCDRTGCEKPARDYLLFPWGASALCGPHLLEDVRPRKRRR